MITNPETRQIISETVEALKPIDLDTDLTWPDAIVDAAASRLLDRITEEEMKWMVAHLSALINEGGHVDWTIISLRDYVVLCLSDGTWFTCTAAATSPQEAIEAITVELDPATAKAEIDILAAWDASALHFVTEN